VILALLLALQDPQAPPPVATVPRIEAEVQVDGVLDEPVWSQAVVLDGFHQYQPVDGRPAEERTEVLVWYSPTHVHFGIRAHDRSPGTVRANVADRDRIGSDDKVVLYLDTFSDRRRAFVFGVNPLGIQEDGVLSEGSGSGAGTLGGGGLDRSPDFIWQSRGRVTDDGYVVEIRIPFKSLRYAGSGPQAWGFNVERTTRRTGYVDTWSDVRRANASFLAQSGRLEGLHELRSGIVTEVQPFATAIASGARDDTGSMDQGSLNPDAGVNLRLSRTNLALDATVNPDFSQILPDFGLVTVNERFALFIPERREFFLEGIDLFNTPNQLIYTRQVIDPVAGAKFTGKFGRLGTAYLGALDQGLDAEDPDALFNIARFRYDIGRNSLAGVTATDREAGADFNRVLAVDSRIVFAKLYYAQAQIGQSWSPDTSGNIWLGEVDRTGRKWGFNVQATGVSPGFETDAGFVVRKDIITARLFNRFSWYGKRGALVEQFSLFLNPRRLFPYGRSYGDGGAIEGQDRVNVDMRLRGNWNLAAAVTRNFFWFNPASYEGLVVGAPDGPAYVPAQKVDNLFGGSFTLTSPPWEKFDAAVTLNYGEIPLFAEAGKGTELRGTMAVGMRPTTSLRVALALVATRIERSTGGEYARTLLPRVTLEYQPVRQLFFRLFAEYRSDQRQTLIDPVTGQTLYDEDGGPAGGLDFSGVRTDFLAQYLPSPGTVAYIGYATDFDNQYPVEGSELTQFQDRFFVKLAYFFRR
jgi:hypothetical protein